jgi:hypothetical protein
VQDVPTPGWSSEIRKAIFSLQTLYSQGHGIAAEAESYSYVSKEFVFQELNLLTAIQRSKLWAVVQEIKIKAAYCGRAR